MGLPRRTPLQLSLPPEWSLPDPATLVDPNGVLATTRWTNTAGSLTITQGALVVSAPEFVINYAGATRVYSTITGALRDTFTETFSVAPTPGVSPAIGGYTITPAASGTALATTVSRW